jgi:hypothetical protein
MAAMENQIRESNQSPEELRTHARDLRAEAEQTDVSREGSLTGPLGTAATEGLIEEDSNYAGYWKLTSDGQTRLDSPLSVLSSRPRPSKSP